jgi:hypothetical protein
MNILNKKYLNKALSIIRSVMFTLSYLLINLTGYLILLITITLLSYVFYGTRGVSDAELVISVVVIPFIASLFVSIYLTLRLVLCSIKHKTPLLEQSGIARKLLEAI